MAKIVEGGLSAKGFKMAIIVSRFNDFITSKLVEGATDVLRRCGCDEDNVTVFKVPGALEIPPLARKLTVLDKFDAIICLGTVIRGATPHFDFVAAENAKGIAKLSMDCNIPIIYGVLTTETIEQAVERAGTKHGNKGADAALVAIEMVNVYKQIDGSGHGVGFQTDK